MRLRFRIAVALTVPQFLALPIDASAQRDTLRVGLLLAQEAAARGGGQPVARGVQLGAEEATRTAALFDLGIAVVPETAVDGLDRATERLLAKRVDAVIVAGAIDCVTVWRVVARRALLLFVDDCSIDAPASDRCTRTAFHLGPTPTTRQGLRTSLVRQTLDSAVDSGRVALWHHTLHRFGAAQLNERYRRRFGRDMDSRSWAGWLAMKILAESALRARSTRSEELARYLMRPRTRFDGHKGEPLTFDPRTGELRQPMYALAGTTEDGRGERVVSELSAAAAFSPMSDRATCPDEREAPS